MLLHNVDIRAEIPRNFTGCNEILLQYTKPNIQHGNLTNKFTKFVQNAEKRM